MRSIRIFINFLLNKFTDIKKEKKMHNYFTKKSKSLLKVITNYLANKSLKSSYFSDKEKNHCYRWLNFTKRLLILPR